MTICRLSDIVSPAFAEPHRALKSGAVNQLVLKGGRGSAKSSYASIEGILKIIANPNIHGVVMRKVGNTLRTSVYAQYYWAISALGLHDKFKATISPMELTYKKTGQKIMFFGADDPGKIKSIKVPFGYIGYLHFEELDQFAGEAEIRNIEQSILRGGPLAFEIKSFNPPRTRDNWANKYCLVDKPGQFIHHSTYLTTPQEWLGQRFLDDAEFLKETNPAAYEHEYEGAANGAGGSVFENIKAEPIPDSLIASFDSILNGIDWGYYPDPWTFNRVQFDRASRILYVFYEDKALKKSARQTVDRVKATIRSGDVVTCDNREENCADYRAFGVSARSAIKGPDSRKYSYEWLQSLNAIWVDPVRCPQTLNELMNYEYERDKDGNVVSGYPDGNDHHIDAIRYATERIWRRRGQ